MASRSAGRGLGAFDVLLGLCLMAVTGGIVWKSVQVKKDRALWKPQRRHNMPLEIGTVATQAMQFRHASRQTDSGSASPRGEDPTRSDDAKPRAKAGQAQTEEKKRPSLDGLEINPMSGRHALPRTELFVHQGNYNKLMGHYAAEGQLVIHNNRSFPSADMHILMRYNFTNCAVVGNSGSMLNSTFGSAIDSHNVVLRINQAPPGLPTNRYKRHVGEKTTFRLINTRWTGKYGVTNYVDEGKLPLEQSVTVIVTRARPHLYDSFVQTLKKSRSDVSVLYLSSRVVGAAHRLLQGYRERLTQAGTVPFEGGDTPSSGFIAAYLLLQACQTTTLYGFGLDAGQGVPQEYHYFHVFSPKHSKKKNSMNPTHSFDTERELLRALAESGHLEFCSFEPGDSKHNRRCGAKASDRKNGKGGKKSTVETETFMELDMAQAIKGRKKPSK